MNEQKWRFLYAAERGNINAVENLLARGVNPDAHNAYGVTALHFAAQDGYTSIVNKLLAHGANPDAQDEYGVTPLHLAADAGHVPVVENLLAHGANRNASTLVHGQTPLHLAAQQGHINTVIKLLARGANPDAHNADGFTPLHFAARGGHINVVGELLARGANRNALTRDGHRRTPLHLAALKGRPDVVKLLAHGDTKDAQDARGFTPLHLAADRGHVPVVENLLARGAKHNTSTPRGFTPLHSAAYSGHTPVVETLFSKMKKANRLAKANNGKNAFNAAQNQGHYGTANFLVAKDPKEILGRKSARNKLHDHQRTHLLDVQPRLQMEVDRGFEKHNLPYGVRKNIAHAAYGWGNMYYKEPYTSTGKILGKRVRASLQR